MPFSARMQIVLTNASAHHRQSNIEHRNDQTIHPPSTITNIGIVEALPLNATFDASSFSQVCGTCLFVSFGMMEAVLRHGYIQEFDVTFSNYIAEMVGAAKRTTAPGDSTTLFYIIKNIGSTTDIFDHQR